MLVLTRYVDEAIAIDEVIVVTVLGVWGDGRVKLGISAPADVPVHRMEVQRAIWRDGFDAGRERREGGGA
jgi:carbon storage regulator